MKIVVLTLVVFALLATPYNAQGIEIVVKGSHITNLKVINQLIDESFAQDAKNGGYSFPGVEVRFRDPDTKGLLITTGWWQTRQTADKKITYNFPEDLGIPSLTDIHTQQVKINKNMFWLFPTI